MVEDSRPWPGITLGDAGLYTDEEWAETWGILFGSYITPYNYAGPIQNWLNELAVTVLAANLVQVATGAALVRGRFYENTAALQLAVPSATAGHWREDLICLQADYVAQTIRAYRHANPAQDVGYPAPTQTAGVVWEIPLAVAHVTDAGAVTVTDLRVWASDLMQPKSFFIPASAYCPAGSAWVALGGHVAISRTATGELCRFEFRLPKDFKEFVSAYLVFQNTSAKNIDWTLVAVAAQCAGANLARWTDTATADGRAPTAGFDCIDISAAFDSGSLLAADNVGAIFTIDVITGGAPANTLYVFGLALRYR